ncbi:folate-binding protein YgfZ [Gilvimarinus sp. DA14]|uniref:CAF17-like 4Fe-4S cluster assembly/insertion protein YgfZ n=1 Tax=Gilvimarinus sp. DA14 TaxID=2956798 RepID=UPI0020B64747|nr:folate-binding protein [Gilvimarinus sp. DA14]UTF61081.1 folate-binding protein [Gilvimarinus sp. DA14]
MSHWQEFLESQGARRRDNGGYAFAGDTQPLCSTSTWLSPLGHQGFISLTGPDATKFLQGQVTCDVRELEKQQWLQGAQCNLKGRIVASFKLAALDSENLLLKTSADLLQTLLTSLQKYAVFSKVTLAADSQWLAFGLCGPSAAALVEQQTGLAPDIHGFQASDTVIALQHEPDRYELWVKVENAQKLWLSLAEHCQLAGTEHWQLSDIGAGIAEVDAATSERFTPQDLNYQLIGAVSFKKGCYTGQEVVARLHYKATLKKHLYRIAGAGEPPAAGTSICDAQGKNRGEVVQAIATDQGFEALAVLPSADENTLQLSDSGEPVTRLSLPYSIPSADNSD